jgi:hypothetical protein
MKSESESPITVGKKSQKKHLRIDALKNRLIYSKKFG